MDSVITYKEKVNKRFPKKKYIEMSNQDFLTEIGPALWIVCRGGETQAGSIIVFGAGTHNKRSISALSFGLF